MKVAYVYDELVGLHSYGKDHPMNPFRITMTHSLVKSYGLESSMSIFRSENMDMTYHPQTYIESLGSKSTVDCPSFTNLKDFSIRYASASINAAILLDSEQYDCVINWSGGLHHAHKEEESGFCFTNDIVMAALELLKTRERVMYIDIDAHHGDGVEEAFYDCDRVLTCSFHKYGDNFFPGTGPLVTSGKKVINIPLQTGIDDASYKYIYEPIIDISIRNFSPNVIIFQAGADSLGEDRLGVFDLSIEGHGKCLEFVKTYNIPILLLGGGGYTIHNVSRCWAYETSLVCGKKIPDFIPETDPFYHMFSPDYLSTPRYAKKYVNCNKKKYLDSVIDFVTEKIERF